MHPFLFFSHYVQRYHVQLDHHFESLETMFRYSQYGSLPGPEDPFAPYIEIVYRHIDNPELFWYVCVLFFTSTMMLQRFVSYWMIEMWRANPTFTPVPYKTIQGWDRKTLLKTLSDYANRDDVYFWSILLSMPAFF